MTIGEWIWTVWFWAVQSCFAITAILVFRVQWASRRTLAMRDFDATFDLLALAKRLTWILWAFALAVQVLVWPHLIWHHFGHHL